MGAEERAAPAPFDANSPVKQTPLAWLRRCPTGSPPRRLSASTIRTGVRRRGLSQPAVYAKASAPTAAMRAMPAIAESAGRPEAGLLAVLFGVASRSERP